MDEQGNQPLQIDFTLSTDLVINQPIHLDALLVYFLNEAGEDHGTYKDSIIENWPLPLRKLQIGGKWFWDCSDSIVIEHKRALDTIKRKFTIDDLPMKSVNVAGLKYGSKITTFERIQTECIRFFAYGNLCALKPIIGRIRSIGMLRAHGFGVVKGFEIKPIDMDFCCWDRQQQILLRNIPLSGDPFEFLLDRNVTIKQGRYRPPYYDRSKRDENIVPLICQGSKFNLEDVLDVLNVSQ